MSLQMITCYCPAFGVCRIFFTKKKELYEDPLGITPLEKHTRGEKVYKAITVGLRKRGINLKPSQSPDRQVTNLIL